ncbi:MAG: hypothetical protein LC772_03950 [Chloroflexi bacterium]|nr:hypothetical protein [Chloroflexota bacterium]
MTRTVLARNGLALIAFCTLLMLAPLAGASAAPGASGVAPSLSGNWPLRAQLMRQPTYLSPAMMRSLRTASLKSRQQPGNTGSGPGLGQQLPRDLDLTFVDNPAAPGNVNAVTKASLPPYTDWEPAYGPDRHTIIFSSDRPVGTATTSTGFHLWTMQTDGSYQQQLPNTTGTDQEWPAYSADGAMIAYSARDANNVRQIHILNLGSGADSVITDSSGDKTHPTWSQNVIAFQSTERTAQNPSGLNKIWLVNYTGGARAQLTGIGSWDSTNAATSQDTEPAWEPNGIHIAFTRLETRRSGLPVQPRHQSRQRRARVCQHPEEQRQLSAV